MGILYRNSVAASYQQLISIIFDILKFIELNSPFGKIPKLRIGVVGGGGWCWACLWSKVSILAAVALWEHYGRQAGRDICWVGPAARACEALASESGT